MVPSDMHHPAAAPSPNPSAHLHHRFPGGAELNTTGHENPPQIGRVRLSDIVPYDGAPDGTYLGAVEALSDSLTRHNAAAIELVPSDGAILGCALESTRMFFRARAQCGGSWGRSSRGAYVYRAGRYLLKILDSGESVRLQYRSLQKLQSAQTGDSVVLPLQLIDNGS